MATVLDWDSWEAWPHRNTWSSLH